MTIIKRSGYIAAELEVGPNLKMDATDLNNRSKNSIKRIFSFMSETYEMLHEIFGVWQKHGILSDLVFNMSL